MAKRAVELENQIESSEHLLTKLKSRCVDSEEEEKMRKYETQLSTITSTLDAMKKESIHVKEIQCEPVKPAAIPAKIDEAPKVEDPIEVQTLITPLLEEKKIAEVAEEPKLETTKEPLPAPPVPKIAKQPPAKKVTAKPKAKAKRKRKSKAKKRLKKKTQTKQSMAERPHSRSSSGGHCRNPWNGECKNTDIEVTIYYKKELLPICRSCWSKIAEKDLSW